MIRESAIEHYGMEMKRELGAVQQWLIRNRWVIVGSLVLAMALYFPIVQYGLENLDSFCTAEPYWADRWELIPYWETVQGRWALQWNDVLSDGMHPYFITVLLTSAFFLLASLVLCDLLGVHNAWVCFVCASLLLCSQYAMNIQSYRYCSTAYAMSFFLAVWAVYLAGRGTVAATLLGSICLAVSLGQYQSSLGVAAVVCLCLLMKTLLQQDRYGGKFRTLLVHFLSMGGIGVVVYLVVLKLLLKVYHVSLAPINGINQVGIGLLSQLPQGIAQAYRDFFQYFFGRQIAQNYYTIRPLYGLLLLCATACLLYAMVRWRKSRITWAGIILCILLVPAAANITDIINPTTHIMLRMAGGMATIPLLSVAWLVQGIRLRFDGLQKAGTMVLALLLLRGYILQSNNDIQVLLTDKTQSLTLGSEIYAQLMETEEFLQGAPVIIQGCPAVVPSEYRDRTNPLFQNGVFLSDGSNNRDAWIRLMGQELGISMSWCDFERQGKITASDVFQAMPGFPQEGSIQVIDGVVVVKVM